MMCVYVYVHALMRHALGAHPSHQHGHYVFRFPWRVWNWLQSLYLASMKTVIDVCVNVQCHVLFTTPRIKVPLSFLS